LFFTYNSMILLVFLSYFKFFSFSWILKDVGVALFLMYVFIKVKPIKIKFPTFGFFIMYLFMILLIAAHFIANGFDFISLISIRFLFVYLLLILVGFNFGKYFTEKKMFFLIFGIYWFIILVGVLEWINPALVHVYTVGDNIDALRRSGLGYGLGSLFGDRVIFGFVLTYFLIISRIFIKSRSKLFILQIFIFSLVVSTLSKTAIFASMIIILIDLIDYLRSKEKNNILTKAFFVLFLLLSVSFVVFRFNDLINTLFLAVNSADFSTFSGRTDNWSNLDYSILPNFNYVGSSKTLGIGFDVVVDSAFLRMVINFGLLIVIPIIMIIFEFLKNWKNINKTLKYTLLMLLIYSVTVDFYHIVIVVIPMWFSIGYYLYQSKSNKKKKRL